MIGYISLRLVVELFRLLPYRAMYVLSDGLAFLLYRVIGYRKKVVLENLRRSFPEKNGDEIRRIARLSYRNLTDVTLETLKSITAPLAEIERRCVPLNTEAMNKYLDRGQAIIVAGAHYNNWEYPCLSLPPLTHGQIVVAYKPLTNKKLDAWLNKMRERAGVKMISMEEVYAVMRKRKGEADAYFLVSDQSPSSRKSAHWVEFLGQDTATLPGMDMLSRKFGYPVVYFHIRRVRRGFYEMTFGDLWPDTATAGEADITRAYTRRVETGIREQPENWLWSHKRWKIRREQ